jgi:hypothetical protein
MNKRYSDYQISEAWARYNLLNNLVLERLLCNPEITSNKITAIVNASSDFLSLRGIKQNSVSGVPFSQITWGLELCREEYLNKHPKLPEDVPLEHLFTEMGLQPTDLFYFVAHDDSTYSYVMRNAKLITNLPKARLMESEDSIPFYLTTAPAVNEQYPAPFIINKDMRRLVGGDLSGLFHP